MKVGLGSFKPVLQLFDLQPVRKCWTILKLLQGENATAYWEADWNANEESFIALTPVVCTIKGLGS